MTWTRPAIPSEGGLAGAYWRRQDGGGRCRGSPGGRCRSRPPWACGRPGGSGGSTWGAQVGAALPDLARDSGRFAAALAPAVWVGDGAAGVGQLAAGLYQSAVDSQTLPIVSCRPGTGPPAPCPRTHPAPGSGPGTPLLGVGRPASPLTRNPSCRRSSVRIRPRAPPHGRHSANGPSEAHRNRACRPAARGAERHIQPVMGGIAGMDPALHAAHGPTGTVPT